MERTDRLESLRVNPLRYRLLKTEREMSEETGFQIGKRSGVVTARGELRLC